MAVDFTKLSPEELEAVMEMPILEPPKGEVSNFVNPPNQNGLAIGVTTACGTVVLICLAIRLYAKLGLMKKAQAQEYLVLLAFVCHSPGFPLGPAQTDRLLARDASSAGLTPPRV